MKKLAATLISALAFAAPLAQAQAQAQAPVQAPAPSAALDPKAVAAVKDLLETIKFRDLMAQTNEQMAAQLPQMLMAHSTQALQNDATLSAADRKEAMAMIEAKMPEIVAAVRDVISDPKLVDELAAAMPALYARHFTVEEIVEMSRFYKTPLGAKSLKVMPQLMAESMQLGQQLVAPRIQAMTERIMKTMDVKPGK